MWVKDNKKTNAKISFQYNPLVNRVRSQSLNPDITNLDATEIDYMINSESERIKVRLELEMVYLDGWPYNFRLNHSSPFSALCRALLFLKWLRWPHLPAHSYKVKINQNDMSNHPFKPNGK